MVDANDIKNHPVIFYLTFFLAAFAMGWGAHIAIQAAAGLVSIPADKAKLIDSYESVVKERDKLVQREIQLLDAPGYPARILALEAERDQLRKEILLNQQTKGALISNITLLPASPAILKVGEDIIVDFEYSIPKGVKAGIWALPLDSSDLQGSYAGSEQLEGTGRARRNFTVRRAGKLTRIHVYASGDTGTLYEIQIPVNYIFR